MGEIWANSSDKKGPDHKRHWCKRDGMLSHPAAGLVVVEVHQLAGAVQSPGNFIGFSLADVDKVLSKSEQGEVRSSQQEYRYLDIYKTAPHLYPYSMLSPHPPQIHADLRSFGLLAPLQPQLAS